MTILETTDLKKYYGAGENITKALDGVSLKIEDGQFVAIVGASGSGKSTLLNMIGGLDNPTSGNVLVKGKSIGMLKEEELTIFRRRNIGFVFQNYNLIPTLNVYENIVFPVELDGKNVDQTFLIRLFPYLGLIRNWKIYQTIYLEGSSKGLPLPGRSLRNRQSYWQMNRREILIHSQALRLWGCSNRQVRGSVRQLL